MKTWDTRQLAPSQQFGYWREVLCEAFTALDSLPRAPRAYGSTVHLHEMAQVNAVELSSFAQEVVRGQDEIRRRADAYFFVNLQLEGRCAVEQDGRHIEVAPGSFYLVDTTRPYRLGFVDSFRALSFRVPHPQLLPLLPEPRKVTALQVDAAAGIGSLAAAHMQGIMRCAAELSPATGPGLSSTLAELVAMSLRGPATANAGSRDVVRRAFRESIIRYVEANSADPDLSVAAVSSRFRVSVRYVHEVFAEHPYSFAQTVLERRLAAAAAALLDPGATVTGVALACGFGDLSYFGRAFRRRHGCTPREWRMQGGCARTH